MSGGIRLEGMEELQKALKKNCTMNDVKVLVKKNGADLDRQAQRTAPVDTGNLKRSIGLEIENGGMTAVVTPAAEYAPYVEYGTRFMSAQPFLSPSLSSVGPKFIADLNKLMK